MTESSSLAIFAYHLSRVEIADELAKVRVRSTPDSGTVHVERRLREMAEPLLRLTKRLIFGARQPIVDGCLHWRRFAHSDHGRAQLETFSVDELLSLQVSHPVSAKFVYGGTSPSGDLDGTRLEFMHGPNGHESTL